MKKYRIGIIGAENSHSNGFSWYFNKPDDNGNLQCPDCRVTCVTGHYPEANEKLAQTFEIDNVVSSVDEMLPQVDAVMVTARDGKFHAEFAKPFIEAGMPAFIDKPFTVDPAEAKALVELAKEKNVPLCGGSSLKFTDTIVDLKKFVKETQAEILGAALSAPVALYSEYSGFFFYASHLVEMTLEVFGYNPRSISAVKHDHSVCATINYDNFSVTNHFKETSDDFTVALYTSAGTQLHKVDLGNSGLRECEVFADMLHEGKMYNTYEELIIPVYYMDAVKRAYETGETVTLTF